MFDFLIWGLFPLCTVFLEIWISEVLWHHESPTRQPWPDSVLKIWERHELRCLVASTLIVGLVTTALMYYDIHLTGAWANWGKIFGGFGFCIFPFYLRRMFFNSKKTH